MLIVVFAAVCIVFAVLTKKFEESLTAGDICFCMYCISIVLVSVSLLCVIFAHTGLEGYVAEKWMEYESLTFQLENKLYENDNDFGKKELYNQVQEWNENLASNKANQNDFWIGIFIPDVYDQFEFIDYQEGTC